MIEAIEQPEGAPQPRASRWLRNGDHPDDRVGQEETDPVTGESWIRREGAVVRWYCRPDRPDSERHKGPGGCWKPWAEHGWINQGGAGLDGLDVCPGNLVIDWPDGTHTVARLQEVYRDRTDNYVPAGLNLDGAAQFAEISEGQEGRSAAALEVYMSAAAGVIRGLVDAITSQGHPAVDVERTLHAAGQWLRTMAEPAGYERAVKPRAARVALAMPDEHNRDQRDWWWADVSGDGTHWSAFRGHRTQVDVTFSTMNYRDVNEWKGRDDIRAGGSWQISLNRQPVYEGTIGNDPLYALDRLREKLRWLLQDADHGPLDLTDPRPFREQLMGRRVYYHDVPAVITSTVLGQGCVILEPVGRSHFPRQAPDLDAEPDGTGHDEQDLWDEHEERSVKVEIDSPHIWWWRRRSFNPLEPDQRYRPLRGAAARRAQEIEGDGPEEGSVVKQRSRWEPLSAVLPAQRTEEGAEAPQGEQVGEEAAQRAAESMPVVAEDDEDDLPAVGADGEPEGNQGDGPGDQPEA